MFTCTGGTSRVTPLTCPSVPIIIGARFTAQLALIPLQAVDKERQNYSKGFNAEAEPQIYFLHFTSLYKKEGVNLHMPEHIRGEG